MKRIFVFLLLIVGLSKTVLSQKVIDDANAEKRNVTGFHGIDVATGIKLIITKGDTEDVAVSASKIEYRDKIVTEVKNGILHIYYETKTGSINRKNETKS